MSKSKDWLRVAFVAAIVVFSVCMVFVGFSVYSAQSVTESTTFSLTSITGTPTVTISTASQTPTVSTVASVATECTGYDPYLCHYSLLSLLLLSGPVLLSVVFWVVLISGLLALGFLFAILSKRLRK